MINKYNLFMHNDLYVKSIIESLKPHILGSVVFASNKPLFSIFNSTIVKIDHIKNTIYLELWDFELNTPKILICEIGNGVFLKTYNHTFEFKNVTFFSTPQFLDFLKS
tara:strand:+ start:623 stop:946 length:324 start_codon:yes stop_codon:yes gene_type:complete